MLVSGPTFEEEDIFHCVFDGTIVEAVYISEEYVSCVSPRLFTTTRITFELMINSIPFDLTTAFYPCKCYNAMAVVQPAYLLCFLLYSVFGRDW